MEDIVYDEALRETNTQQRMGEKIQEGINFSYERLYVTSASFLSKAPPITS